MSFYTRSDLACENFGDVRKLPEGSDMISNKKGNIQISRLSIRSSSAAQTLGKPIGEYVSLACGKLHYLSADEEDCLIELISNELTNMAKRLTDRALNTEFSVLAVGLGNAELTADAIGPATVAKLTATRHLRKEEPKLYQMLGCTELSAFCPGVLGQTGIETLELIRGAVKAASPHLVVVIDALAARSCERLAATVQISDVGICPGSGVGNHRSAVTRESLGVPVLSLGIPTVVRSSTLVWDALQKAGIREENGSLQHVLESGESFFVTPKESDVITAAAAALLARALSAAFSV